LAYTLDGIFPIEPNLLNGHSEIVELIVKYSGDILHIKNIIDAYIELLDENYAIITIKKDLIPMLYKFPEIEYIELPKTLTLTSNLRSNLNLNRTCIAQVHNDPVYNLQGVGVLIGIIRLNH